MDEILSNPLSWLLFGLFMSVVTTIVQYFRRR